MSNTYNNDIFQRKEYYDFINSSKLTECHKKSLLNYYELKFEIFVNNNSNYQVKTFFEDAFKNNDIEEITRLQLLFIHFVNFKLSCRIIDLLKNNSNLKDDFIVNFIEKNNKKNKVIYSKYLVCDKWIYAIQKLVLIYLNDIKDTKNTKDTIYLDIGCGNAKKTGFFSKYLKLKKENTYCTDIKTWGPYQKNKSKLPFQFKYIINNKLDYKDKTFNLVTCILTLHHVQNMNDFIIEVNRIIKPGGYLLLIEHSVYTDYDRLFVNIQHMMYSKFYDKRNNYIKNPDHIYCYNMFEWNLIMLKNNFIMKKCDILVFDNEYSMKYDNIFYGFYCKK